MLWAGFGCFNQSESALQSQFEEVRFALAVPLYIDGARGAY